MPRTGSTPPAVRRRRIHFLAAIAVVAVAAIALLPSARAETFGHRVSGAPAGAVPPPARRAAAPRPVAAIPAGLAGPLACIRHYESAGEYRIDTGDGHYGAYQFLASTWNYTVARLGLKSYENGRADLAPPAVQDAAAVKLAETFGWRLWQTAPLCGLR